MRLTEEDIKVINKSLKDSWNQGIFTEPNWIPDDIKEPVIYMRWESGGVSGGSCWDDSDPRPYNIDERPAFEVLDSVLMKLCPNISYLTYKKVETLIRSNSKTEWEYYGNCTDWTVEYVVLSELYKLLGI
jgi:hypothetical protein